MRTSSSVGCGGTKELERSLREDEGDIVNFVSLEFDSCPDTGLGNGILGEVTVTEKIECSGSCKSSASKGGSIPGPARRYFRRTDGSHQFSSSYTDLVSIWTPELLVGDIYSRLSKSSALSAGFVQAEAGGPRVDQVESSVAQVFEMSLDQLDFAQWISSSIAACMASAGIMPNSSGTAIASDMLLLP